MPEKIGRRPISLLPASAFCRRHRSHLHGATFLRLGLWRFVGATAAALWDLARVPAVTILVRDNNDSADARCAEQAE